jgi:hypothetical protein
MRTITIKLADGRTITKRVDERGIVPNGGTTGQMLGKLSDTDFDVDWIDGGADLSGDELDAIQNANNPSLYNVFATMNDLPADELTADELAAINDANNPSALNVFATMDDLSSMGGGTYAAGSGIEIIAGSPDDTINIGGTFLPGTIVAFDNSSVTFGTNSDIVSGTMVQFSDLGGVVSDIILKVGNFAGDYAYIQLNRSLHAVERIQFDYLKGVERCQTFYDEKGFIIEDNDTGLDAITLRTAGHHGWLPHRKYVDDAIAAAVAGGAGETYVAGDGIIITPGSPDNIISIDLSGDELDAIQNANAPSLYNVFATINDLPGDELTGDELAAINGANAPTAANVFATMNDIPANELSGDELDAIQQSNAPSLYNVFATMADLPADELSTDQLAAITGAASPSAINVFATMNDIPPDELTGNELDAVQNANNPSLYNVFATMSDIPDDELTGNELAAINGAASPSASNVFATMDDIPADELTGDQLDAIQYSSAPSLYNPFLTDSAADALYAPIAKGVTNGDSHDHNGGDGGQIAYSSLSGLPTLGTIADNAESDFAVAAKGVTNGDSHNHDGGDGGQIDHTKLATIGTNTHAQIDTHMTDHGDARNSKSCTDNTLTSLFKITGLGNAGTSLVIMYSAVCVSGTTQVQTRTGMVYLAVEKPITGNYVSGIGDVGTTVVAVSGGTITVVWSTADASTESTIKVTIDSSLNVATTLLYQIYDVRGVGTITYL